MAALGEDPTIRRQVVAAARTVLAQDAAAPVARIATEAGVSRATFYRHFESRGALLATIAHDPPPEARARILEAAQDMLLGSSLSDLSMDELARAAGVSRGTLYRIFPGKPALFRALVETYSPFEAMLAIIGRHAGDPPEVVLPLIAHAVVGIAERRHGLMRAVFHEATGGSAASLAGARPVLGPALGALGDYLATQMGARRLRRMDPFLALQAFIGPIYFHLMTRPMAAQIIDLRVSAEDAVDQLVAAIMAGLVPAEG
jgi:AcrR family transcriptional regulator